MESAKETTNAQKTQPASYFFHSFPQMTMRMTPGKIYAGTAIFVIGLSLRNRMTNRGLKERVDGIVAEKQRQIDLNAAIAKQSRPSS